MCTYVVAAVDAELMRGEKCREEGRHERTQGSGCGHRGRCHIRGMLHMEEEEDGEEKGGRRKKSCVRTYALYVRTTSSSACIRTYVRT